MLRVDTSEELLWCQCEGKSALLTGSDHGNSSRLATFTDTWYLNNTRDTAARF
jgi:hypothetical protein